MFRKLLTGLFCSLICLTVGAQDLSNIGNGPNFSLSGNVSMGTYYYQSQGGSERNSPFYIAANPTISVFGFDIPFSFVYRDQKGSFSSPFNRVSISPTYKWVSVHLGTRSYNYHPYAVSGQLIKGAGFDLKPGIFRLSAAYGKVQNPLAQVDTLLVDLDLFESYTRNAITSRIGIESKFIDIAFTGFSAKDDINSLQIDPDQSKKLKPEENAVLGLELNLSPIKFINLYSNVAASLHTANQFATSEIDSSITAVLDRFDGIFTLNVSSRLQFAGDGGFDLKFKNFNIGLNYQRVDPFYKSLGTFYFLEDYENYTVKLGFSAWKGRIRFNGRGGLQRNNLNQLRSITSQRRIANLNLTIVPNRNFSLSGRFTNFQTQNAPQVVSLNDSLQLARTTATYGLIPRITFGSKDAPSTIIISATYQNLEDLVNGISSDRNIENLTGNINYTKQLRNLHMNFGTNLIFNQNTVMDIENRRLGGSIRWGKSMLDRKLKLNTSIGYFQNFYNGTVDGQSITGALSINYSIARQYRFSVRTNYVNRSSQNSSSFSTIRGNVGFTYVFNTKKLED